MHDNETTDFALSITAQPDDAAHPWVARCGSPPEAPVARPGRTRREAAMRALEECLPEEGEAALAL